MKIHHGAPSAVCLAEIGAKTLGGGGEGGIAGGGNLKGFGKGGRVEFCLGGFGQAFGESSGESGDASGTTTAPNGIYCCIWLCRFR